MRLILQVFLPLRFASCGFIQKDKFTDTEIQTDKERLDTSLERFFRWLPVDKPVIRTNHFVQTNHELMGAW